MDDYSKYQDTINRYAACMEEIKLRSDSMRLVVTNERNTGYLQTNTEFLCLQQRMIFELIVLANLVSNKDEYAKHRASFATDWNAKKIIGTLEKINPNFYPSPSTQRIDSETGKVLEAVPITEGYLTKLELIEGMDFCADWLHACNPFSQSKDIVLVYDKLIEWQKKIVVLLNHHHIQLLDPKLQLWVIMHGKGTDKVQVTLFSRID